MKTIKYISFIAFVLVFASCQKLKYDQEFNWAYPVSGDWTIKTQFKDDIEGPFPIKIFNTSFGQDSIWIDTNGNSPEAFKIKAAVDMKTLTFKSNDSFVTISNAKIINKDSIYFEAEYSIHPDTIYQFYGHRRTSYEEYNNLDL